MRKDFESGFLDEAMRKMAEKIAERASKRVDDHIVGWMNVNDQPVTKQVIVNAKEAEFEIIEEEQHG